jgi:hypothetical protein
MRVVLLVGHDSDGIASVPTRVQVRCVVHSHDKISPDTVARPLLIAVSLET